ASTAPSSRLRTQPATPCARARSRAVSRKNTPWTRPETTTRRRIGAIPRSVPRRGLEERFAGAVDRRQGAAHLLEQLAHAAGHLVEDRAGALDAVRGAGELELDLADVVHRV